MMRSSSESIAHVDRLDALEHHEHLHLAHSSIEVGIALRDSVPDGLVVHRGSHTHHQADISVGIEEFWAFQLPTDVIIVSLVDDINFVSEELVMVVRVPSITVIDKNISVHALVVGTGVSPSVE